VTLKVARSFHEWYHFREIARVFLEHLLILVKILMVQLVFITREDQIAVSAPILRYVRFIFAL
jgi:hypothetical protein